MMPMCLSGPSIASRASDRKLGSTMVSLLSVKMYSAPASRAFLMPTLLPSAKPKFFVFCKNTTDLGRLRLF